MNPYAIIAAILVLLSGISGGYFKGHADGKNDQSVADQGAIDDVNAKLTANKAKAAQILAASREDKDKLEAERTTLTKQLETEHEANRVATNALRTQLAGERLRYKTGIAGAGDGGTDASGQQSSPAGNAEATTAELPDPIKADLFALTYDADSLRDDYTLLYQWAHSDAVRCK